ncbi:MAG: hypothetical protein ACUVQG_14365 [Thermogutta sp.]
MSRIGGGLLGNSGAPKVFPLWAWIVPLAVVGASITGCGGPQKGTLTGRVTFAGQPIEEGGIRLDPASGTGEPMATKIANGEYRFETGIPVGEYKVFITAQRNAGEVMSPELGQKVSVREQYLPAKYNVQTQLTVKINPGSNSQDFDLTP